MTDCTLWAGSMNSGLPTKSGKSVRRMVWRSYYGEEPDGLLTTSCGNHRCVAIAHICYLQALTTHCVNGHEYTPANERWRVRKDKGETKPSRECRTCWERSKNRKKPADNLSSIIYLRKEKTA